MISSPRAWGDALRLARQEIPDFAFDAWIAPLRVKVTGDRVVLGCPTSFHRDRVRLHYAGILERCWNAAWRALATASSDEATRAEADRRRFLVELALMKDFTASPGYAIETATQGRESSDSRAAETRSHDPIGQAAEGGRGTQRMRPVRPVAAPEPVAAVAAAAQASPRGGSAGDLDASARSHPDPTLLPLSDRGVSPSTTRARIGATQSTGGGSPSAVPGAVGSGWSGGEAAGRPALQAVEAASSSASSALSSAPPSARDAIRAVDAVDATPPTARRRATPRTPARPGRPSASAPSAEWSPRGDGTTELGTTVGEEPLQPELPFSFESFVVGPCNALAREATLALARARQRSLNQLYLGGESGMGKTHLARAAAIEARRHAGLGPVRSAPGRGPASGVVYTTAEQFTSEFVSAMRNGRSEEWQRRYRSRIGLLIVEDVQHLRGREKTQLELFHTVQHVLDAGGRVLLTGDRAPRDLTGLDERVRSQVARGFVAELEPPDALVRRHILRTKASAGGVHLPPDCLDLLVEATTGSVRDIESVLIQVVTTASLLGRAIDLDLTRRAIDLKSGAGTALPPRRLEVDEIVRLVAGFFGKRPEALASRSRRRDVLVPRQLAMYLAHRYTDASLTEIGRGFGRDHPSVRNAITRIERLCLENAPLRYQVEALSERIDQRLAQEREGR